MSPTQAQPNTATSPRTFVWSVISAVNDDAVLKSCLLDSPGIKSAAEVILQRGFKTAAAAYNAAIEKSTTDFLVFVHQDVYFPDGWIETVQKIVAELEQKDPNWGVLGVWGAIDPDTRVGYLWWTGNYGLERPFKGVKEVKCLDEVVLIFRKSSGLRFDENIPGWHLYGADLCTEAAHRGKKNYAISAFCIHNTHIGGILPLQFWKCYFYLRRKWKARLPIDTPCTRISFNCWPMIWWNVLYARNFLLGKQRRLTRAANPAEICHELLSSGKVWPEAIPTRSNRPTQMPADRPAAA